MKYVLKIKKSRYSYERSLSNIILYKLNIYMKELDDLFNDIKVQLNIEKSKYKKLKICKYSFEISKVAILSLATGLSFLNIFAILSIILIPVIDTTKNTANTHFQDYVIYIELNRYI